LADSVLRGILIKEGEYFTGAVDPHLVVVVVGCIEEGGIPLENRVKQSGWNTQAIWK
jgi:hypothetical protein